MDRRTKHLRFAVNDNLKPETVKSILAANLAKEASLYIGETD